MLKIRWHGHSCFSLTDGATTILTDPHDGASLNLLVPDAKPDAITVSHDHQDHVTGLRLFPGVPVYTEPIDATVGSARLRGTETYHDDARGSRLGSNTVWTITLDNIQVTHLGDLGHHLRPSQQFQIGFPDIVMINTGADIPLAEDNIALLSLKIVIPMHYHVPGIDFSYYQMKTVDEFTRGKLNVSYVGNEHSYQRQALPYRETIHVYSFPEDQ